MKPLFSFIIPCYKVEQFLPTCIESIQNQSVKDWEIILVDDGSPDNSGRIADEYAAKENRIKVIHQSNQGVSGARNTALDIAKGDWVWFVDSDDYIVDDALEVLSETIKRHVCDTIFFGLKHQFGTEIQDSPSPTILDATKDEVLENVFCYTNPSMLFSNNILQKFRIRFTTGIKMAEDLELQYKYLTFCQFPISISNCLYIYQHREDSATTNPNTNRNNMSDCLTVSNNLLQFIKYFNSKEQIWMSLRLRTLLKSCLQASEHLSRKERSTLQKSLVYQLQAYDAIGYKSIKDKTLSLACWNLNAYIIILRIYYKIKGIR